ncbi:MAG TPA: hypothetical protein VNA20_05835 [Frankiaceae bacterium]|nr:hypothetical protein [Frankiaceae bacterium]
MSRRLPLAVLAALALTTPVARALPPTPLTEYSTSPNVRLLTNVPTGVGVGGKFSGGYYFQTTARAGGYGTPDGVSDGGLWVFDVKNPESPQLAAHLPLPIWQNEDVDLSAKRKVLLISADRRRPAAQTPTAPGVLFVYDIAEPTRPVLKSAFPLPAEVTDASGAAVGGAGHVANCILDCRYAYVTGARHGQLLVVDLADLAAPKVLGYVKTPAGTTTKAFPSSTHDVHTDKYGNVWVAGSGGTAMYAPIKDPLKPKLLAATTAADNRRTNHLIHHNTMRLDKTTVLIGEEAFNGCGADEPAAHDDPQGGRFQTWRIDLKAKRLVPLDLFQKVIPGVSSCSNHWFDLNASKVVADAFYAGGVRFLDVRNPRNIRQVGWFRASDGAAGQAQYVPGRPDLVYVSDYLRGLDVIKIDAGGKNAKPAAEGDDAVARVPAAKIEFRPSEDFGYACPVPVL